MKIYFIFLLSLLSFSSSAQHCPFDGSRAIIISIKSNNFSLADYSFALVEINPGKDSCKYATAPLIIPFGSVDSALVKKYEGSWTNWATERIKDCSFNQSHNRALVLNQAQGSCMVPKGNDYEFRMRQFEIQIFKSHKLIKKLSVPPSNIYSLCTNAGPWSRMIPIEVNISE